MSRRLRFIAINQKGFTAIDLIMSLAIAGLIITTIAVTIFQIYKLSDRTVNSTSAIQQVENAGYWISRDCLMAQNVALSGGSGFPVVMKWITWDDRVVEITYTLAADKLERGMSLNQGLPQINVVAEKIDVDPAKTSCELDTGGYTFKVTTNVNASSETRTYQVMRRPQSNN